MNSAEMKWFGTRHIDRKPNEEWYITTGVEPLRGLIKGWDQHGVMLLMPDADGKGTTAEVYVPASKIENIAWLV